jgi:endoglucanase
MKKFGIGKEQARYFLPPFEWYNNSIVSWTREMDLTLINFSAGTLSHADYTTPEMRNYRSSDVIYQSVMEYEKKNGMNGFILLVHIGSDPARKDKFYSRLDELVKELKSNGYRFVRVDELMKPAP